MRELLAVTVLLLVACKRTPTAAEEKRDDAMQTAQQLLAAEERRLNGSPVTGESREYRFNHWETTGITSYVVPSDGKEIAIKFSGDSNQESLRAFDALAVPVLFPNDDKGNIVVVGVLEEDVLRTPRHDHLADSEPYHRFRLDSWYLRAPFIRWSHEPMLDDMDPEVTLDTKLRATDFTEPVSGDLSRFVHQ